MKSIESRINKLEAQMPVDEFLVVFGTKGESREAGIKRVMGIRGIKKEVSDFFIIYINLKGSTGLLSDPVNSSASV